MTLVTCGPRGGRLARYSQGPQLGHVVETGDGNTADVVVVQGSAEHAGKKKNITIKTGESSSLLPHHHPTPAASPPRPAETKLHALFPSLL